MKKRFSVQYFHLVHACWHYAGKLRSHMVLVYIFTVCANIIFIFQPFAIGQLINNLQQGGPDLLGNAMKWLGYYALLLLGFWVFQAPSRYIERNLAFTIKKNFLQYYYDLLTRLPVHWHQDNHSGNTTNRVNKASQGLYEFADIQYIHIESLVRFLGAFIALAYISYYVAAVEVLVAIIIIAVLARFDFILIRMIHEKNEQEHSYSSAFFDNISNIASVISFGVAEHTKALLEKALDRIHVPLKRVITVHELKWFTMMILVVIAEIIIMYGYIRMQTSHNNALMLGSLVAIYQYMSSLNRIFSNFAVYYQRLIQQSTDFDSTLPLHKAFDDYAGHREPQTVLQVNRGEVNFNHLNFSYNQGKILFEDFSLFIPSKQKLGLVGHSGAGKTTLVNLLLRYYHNPENHITIDGQDIDEVSHHSLMENIAVIPQDTPLFHTSFLENIRYGKLTATDEEVIEASRQAHAHEFIIQQTGGYDAMVGERGVKLSGGQRQRIAIARAILKNAPILVLDEATSALDSESEHYIQQSLTELMEGKTVIAIAHRLSTIFRLDRLIILEKGKIIEDGSHEELLEKGGYYSRIWNMQTGGFLP